MEMSSSSLAIGSSLLGDARLGASPRVCFPCARSLRRRSGTGFYSVRASGSSESKKSIRLTIQAEAPGKSEPARLVIEVPEQQQHHPSVDNERESVTHVASESAVESPERIHGQAEKEAEHLAADSGHAVQEIAGDLKHKAEETSQQEAKHLGNDPSVENDRESVTHVASESAVESPEKIHEQAEKEAGHVAGRSGHAVEEIAGDLKHKAEEVSQEEAKRLGNDDFDDDAVSLSGTDNGGRPGLEELRKNVEQSGQKARQGLEVAKEAVQKRAKVLAETAEDASQKGSQVVEAAKKGLEELKTRLGGVQEGVAKAVEDAQKNAQQIQKKVEEQMQKQSENRQSDVKKLESELQKGTEELQAHMDDKTIAEKHEAVHDQGVCKQGEEEMVMESFQPSRGEEQATEPGVAKAIKEHVDPALSSLQPELNEEDEIGDGNEHLKDMNNLVMHDSYAPLNDDGSEVRDDQ